MGCSVATTHKIVDSPRKHQAMSALPPTPAARQLFVTTALPYANGNFHIGHIMEYIQADIWVRFQRMQGHEVHFVCADDAHGAPIMIAAEKAGITPQQFVANIAAGRKPYLDGFHIAFDIKEVDGLLLASPLQHVGWAAGQTGDAHGLVKAFHSRVGIGHRGVAQKHPAQLKDAHALCPAIQVELQNL